MSQECFTFVVYMIHELADSWNMLPSQVYSILETSGCLE